ncbi:MAG: RtcB family protein [Oscillospiraceae bacterium]|nr:RtcB family protein [Candidatus Limimonas egerieequi]
MHTIDSDYGVVKIFAKTIENEAIEQIKTIANSPIGENAHIRIMPDAHAGAGCVIGTTMKFNGRVIPNVVGVDIGCGVDAYYIGECKPNLEKLDNVCRNVLVSGMNARSKAIEPRWQEDFILSNLWCKEGLQKIEWIKNSLGTLGGGNHYVELNESKNGYWLVVHSGSRNLGKQVAEYWQKIAKENNGYLEGELASHYLDDMGLVQLWARANREYISNTICEEMEWDITYSISSIHNYIDFKDNYVRKGAISAHEGQLCIIPLNMRDGSLICIGKGNSDWNYSAPHGAGRLMSRSQARKTLKLEDFKESMEGIYSSTVCQETIDEAPFVYKDMGEIMEAIKPTVEIVERIIPIYNFKATD